jgi:hypothetical protein
LEGDVVGGVEMSMAIIVCGGVLCWWMEGRCRLVLS